MGRKKELPLLEKVKITDIGAEGNALARVDNLVVFVPMLIPGDIVDIKVIKKRKKYLEGRVVKFHQYSPDRIEPRCIHFGICGGCKWQHLPYNLQLKYKGKQVRDNIHSFDVARFIEEFIKAPRVAEVYNLLIPITVFPFISLGMVISPPSP